MAIVTDTDLKELKDLIISGFSRQNKIARSEADNYHLERFIFNCA
jgi:hypothetical protein